MAMIDWVDRRLHNWARWKEGGMTGGLGFGASPMWRGVQVDCAGRRDAVIPTDACEASDTNDQIKRLPTELQETIEVYYTETQSRTRLARLLDCAVATVDARLTRAHRLLADEFTAKSKQIEQQRLEAEKAVQSARP